MKRKERKKTIKKIIFKYIYNCFNCERNQMQQMKKQIHFQTQMQILWMIYNILHTYYYIIHTYKHTCIFLYTLTTTISTKSVYVLYFLPLQIKLKLKKNKKISKEIKFKSIRKLSRCQLCHSLDSRQTKNLMENKNKNEKPKKKKQNKYSQTKKLTIYLQDLHLYIQ